MATWLLQANLIAERNAIPLAFTLQRLNIPYVGVEVIPFSDELIQLPSDITEGPYIPYGSVKLLHIAYKKESDRRGVFFNHDRFSVPMWNQNRFDMLNQDVTTMRFDELLSFFKTGKLLLEHIFIRPAHDLKAFAGMVLQQDELVNWIENCQFHTAFTPETLVSFSSAKNIYAEWRWFVVGGKVIDGSMYRYKGQFRKIHETDSRVIDEAQSFADHWLPHETCCMDLALTDNGVKVIEFNCLNGSGFYDHDLDKIALAVTNYVDRL